jgi:hypothetical protein
MLDRLPRETAVEFLLRPRQRGLSTGSLAPAQTGQTGSFFTGAEILFSTMWISATKMYPLAVLRPFGSIPSTVSQTPHRRNPNANEPKHASLLGCHHGPGVLLQGATAKTTILLRRLRLEGSSGEEDAYRDFGF